MSIIRLMNKLIVVYSYNGILLSNKLLICVTWMNLKVRQKKRTHCMIPFIKILENAN